MILLAALLASVSSPQGSSIDPARAAQYFGEAEEAALADDGALWGVSLVGPLVFADPRTRAAAANQPDERGLLAERDGVFVGSIPAEVGIANTGLDWAGVRWTMVMWPPPEELHARVQLLLHESFHRVQPRLKHGAGGALPLHLDAEEGRVWLRLELRALAAALGADGDARREALGDALTFRARRRALFPDARASESALERNEGLAEYTGLRLCGLDERGRAARAAARLRGEDGAGAFVRGFAYVTGPAYGLALDALAPEWRESVDASSDLGELLARALGWSAPAALEPAAEERAARHGAAEIRADERARAAANAKRDAANRARFVDGPLLVLPFGAGASYSFDPTDVVPLAGVGSVYGGARIVDEWGVLEAAGSKALLVDAPGGGFRAVHVPAPRDAAARPVAGEGWSLALADGWTLAPGARAGDWRPVHAP